jgi:hypothetical protein
LGLIDAGDSGIVKAWGVYRVENGKRKSLGFAANKSAAKRVAQTHYASENVVELPARKAS